MATVIVVVIIFFNLFTASGDLRPPIGHHWSPFGMTFGRELANIRHHLNRQVRKKHPVYFIHRRFFRDVMGFKTTTDIFVLRGETNLDITGGSGEDYTTISTNLDTLNREVLLVWEVDIQAGAFPQNAADALANSNALEHLAVNDSVQAEQAVLFLNDVNYIAGKDTVYIGSNSAGQGSYFVVQESKNPDSRDFPSRDKHPLAIITENEIFLRSGFSSSATFVTTDTYQARFRIMAQRAKADADTYAALVTGLL